MVDTILVVDDEVGARTLITIMLERGRFAVVQSANGNDALQKLDEAQKDGFQFSLIVVDAIMPNMSGVELCTEIRKRPESEKIPILFLVARNDANSVMRAMQVGANDYLPKPILHHDVIAKVRQLINDSR